MNRSKPFSLTSDVLLLCRPRFRSALEASLALSLRFDPYLSTAIPTDMHWFPLHGSADAVRDGRIVDHSSFLCGVRERWYCR